MNGDHLTLASRTSPVEAAWAAFDAAALRLRRSYELAARVDTPARRAARMQEAMNVTRLWREFNDLFVTICDGDPGADA